MKRARISATADAITPDVGRMIAGAAESFAPIATSRDGREPRPALVQDDFRREAETPSVHNGRPVWVAVCSELVDGRWEGFVTMRGRTV